LLFVPLTIFFAALAFVLRRRAALPSFAFVLFAAATAGFLLAGHAARSVLAVSVPLDSKAPLLCEGKIAGEAVDNRWGWRFELDLISCERGGSMAPASGRVRVSSPHSYVEGKPLPGETVRAPFVFNRPREFARRGSFSYANYLMSRGAGAVAYARGELQRVRPASGFAAAMSGWRTSLKETIRRSVPGRESQIVEALATGMRSNMEVGVRESFSRAGIAHLLAISGLHVGYVALMIYLLVRFSLGRIPWIVSRAPVRRLAASIALPLVWLYIAFVAFPMSGVRAGLMLTVFFAGVMAGMRQDSLTTLAAAVVALLLAMPLSVLDVSFQLSVVAVLGIIVAAVPVVRRFDSRFSGGGMPGALMRKAFALVAVSASAALFTAPLVAYHFGTFTALGPVTNILAVPLVALCIMPAILIATLLAPFSPWAAGHAFWISGALSGLLMELAEWISERGSMLAGCVEPTALQTALAYAAMALLIALSALPKRLFD